MAESIEQLRIYKSARSLEDQVYELVKQFPSEHFYGLGNNLRRSSAAVSSHIMDAHQLRSYRLKIDELIAMRRKAEITIHYLEEALPLGASQQIINDYTTVIKLSWGLSKWFKNKLDERQEKAEMSAKEQMAAALL